MEATATLKRIPSCLAKKWRKSYSRTCGYVNSRVAINLMWATHWCIWGYKVTAHKISFKRLQW